MRFKKVTEVNNTNINKNESGNPYALDFVTSSAISRINLKFLILYIPILWVGGILTISAWLGFLFYIPFILVLILLPLLFLALYFVFVFEVILMTKLFLILINLIHKPNEGIFPAIMRNNDFEFWCLRIEIKKIGVWLLNNCPLPWADAWAFRWFGMKMDFSSHLMDAWVDVEQVEFGHDVMVGQGAAVMSSMVIGNYLIIKKIVFDDYSVIGGQSTIAPGTIFGKDTMLGAASYTIYNQILDASYIYFGMPARKLHANQLAVSTSSVVKKEIDEIIEEKKDDKNNFLENQ